MRTQRVVRRWPWRWSLIVLAALEITCLPEGSAPESGPLVELVPAGVSADGAWALFDRSVERGFLATAAPVAVRFEGAPALAVVKVYGPAPYELQIWGRAGEALGFPAVDLSRVAPGWHVVAAPAPVTVSAVELRFAPLGWDESAHGVSDRSSGAKPGRPYDGGFVPQWPSRKI